MGYVFLNKPEGQSYADFFAAELFGENWELVTYSTVSRVFYAAAREKKSGHIEAWVILTSADKRGGFNFGYKPIHESAGPFHFRAPAKVLDALTPLEQAYADSIDAERGAYAFAKEWRDTCRKYLARPSITAGTMIEIGSPLTFSDGVSASRFIYTGTRNYFTIPGQQGKYSIPSWRNLDFAVIKDA